MDNLKKYLQQQQDDMNVDSPSDAVWNNIEKAALPKNKGRIRSISLKLAAAAAIISAIVIAGIRLAGNEAGASLAGNTKKPGSLHKELIADSGQPIVSTIVSTASQDTMAPPLKKHRPVKKTDERYAMMESFKENYGQLVSYQLQSIRSTPVYAEDPAYFDDFKSRLKQMDSDEMAIRNSIRRQGISNNLLEQLINVYQQKLDVLKSLQEAINKMNTKVKEQPEADSSGKFYLNI